MLKEVCTLHQESEVQHANIILVGMMGTGKTTVGTLLAERLDYPLVDMDTVIAEKEGMSVQEIFRIHGEAYFRDLESRVLEEVLHQTGQIVSTGGGCVLREWNCTVMLDKGLVVALTADVDHIVNRVAGDDNRPLLAGDTRQRVRTIMEERKEVYQFAHVTVDTSLLTPDEVALQVLTRYRVQAS
ncbi:shikimate kinase [Paenibacillus sp. WLX1005]|uniref:shikimate kinase n=1 Tax=Paenibacillus sp. WLX1005 TaxID=3243766 RepID=UPI003983F60F